MTVNLTAGGSYVEGPVAAGVQYTTVNVTRKRSDPAGLAALNTTAWCVKTLNNTVNNRNNQTLTVQRLMIDLRLGDGKTTGKIKARNTIYGALRNNLIQQWPELFDPIFTTPRGSVALSDMPNARVDVLQEQFVLGVTYALQPQPAYLNITRRTIYAANVTMQSVIERARARINETRFQQLELLNIDVPASSSFNYSFPASIKIADLFVAFNKALGVDAASNALCASQGCTPVWLPTDSTIYLPNGTLPDANSTALNSTFPDNVGLQTGYNLISWSGNTTAYMVCNLPTRGVEYLGVCTDMSVSCVSTSNDSTPYNCTDLSSNQTVSGNLSSIDYRSKCETSCDRQLDCNTLCECYGTCSSTQMCVCKACTDLSSDASTDQSFVDIRDAVSAVSVWLRCACLLKAAYSPAEMPAEMLLEHIVRPSSVLWVSKAACNQLERCMMHIMCRCFLGLRWVGMYDCKCATVHGAAAGACVDHQLVPFVSYSQTSTLLMPLCACRVRLRLPVLPPCLAVLAVACSRTPAPS